MLTCKRCGKKVPTLMRAVFIEQDGSKTVEDICGECWFKEFKKAGGKVESYAGI